MLDYLFVVNTIIILFHCNFYLIWFPAFFLLYSLLLIYDHTENHLEHLVGFKVTLIRFNSILLYIGIAKIKLATLQINFQNEIPIIKDDLTSTRRIGKNIKNDLNWIRLKNNCINAKGEEEK